VIGRNDRDYRDLATHRRVADDLPIRILDQARVGRQFEVAGTPLVVKILERDVGGADVGDVTIDEECEDCFGVDWARWSESHVLVNGAA
jgi:hypothetical protein